MVEREQSDLGAIYCQEAGKAPLLTREEEVELATQYKLGKKAGVRLKESENDGLRPEDRKELESSISQGEKARNKLVESNLRLVISMVKSYQGRGVERNDLIQEGNVGLMRAVERFDPERGNKFSTYATWWIRQAVGRAVALQGRTIRLPIHRVELLKKVGKTRESLGAELGREPKVEEIAEKLGKDQAKIENLLEQAAPPLSLDQNIGEDGGSHLGEFIEDSDGFPPPDEATNGVMGEQLRQVVDSLTPREAKVLRLRFGLVDGDPRTLSEVAEEFKLSRERVRQIQAEALRKLRHPSRARGLKNYLEKG